MMGAVVTDEQATADWLEKLPPRPATDEEQAVRYQLVEDPTLRPGAYTVSDGMTAPGVWGFIVRAHPSVVRAVRVKWPLVDDNARAYGLVVETDDAD